MPQPDDRKTAIAPDEKQINLLDLDEPAPAPTPVPGGRAPKAPSEKTPLGLKIFGVLNIVGGLLLIPEIVLMLLAVGSVFLEGGFDEDSMITQVLYVVMVICVAVTVVAFVILGLRLVRNKRRGARQTAEFIIVLLITDFLCNLMLFGISVDLLAFVVAGVVLVAMLTYIDPALSEERELQRKLRDMETREEAEEGTLGLDETGRGFIALDFFNLFWIFVIACVLGDLIETVYHVVIVDPGHYQVRAGMLWGPFSPIYGFGAVLMTIALNRFHKANILVVFLVSAVIGGAFEYAVSWFLQFAFGVTAWDYTGTFLSIGGRTNFMFMCMWGVLGVMWIKLLLPVMLRVVNLIPWQWRYSLTAVCAALMIFNGAMTLISLDCWYSRLAGLPNDNALMEFCAEHFDNDWMAERFQSMSIDPSDSTRAN
ncbi:MULTISPECIES: putative ABC transporter permease [unclassified Adlercreutzia]|uniref:putative ABC transporter permease n=1 Tax=unclassified Adlercreutzia TaxID=2636013 RepID=UPI001980BFC0|nr:MULTISPECIES: putative ABC transporter permease [unclassified Adlercreutzia]